VEPLARRLDDLSQRTAKDRWRLDEVRKDTEKLAADVAATTDLELRARIGAVRRTYEDADATHSETEAEVDAAKKRMRERGDSLRRDFLLIATSAGFGEASALLALATGEHGLYFAVMAVLGLTLTAYVLVVGYLSRLASTFDLA